MRRFAFPVVCTLAALLGVFPFVVWLASPEMIRPDPGGHPLEWARMLHLSTDLPGLGFWSRAAKPIAYALLGLSVATSGVLGVATVWLAGVKAETRQIAVFLCFFPLALAIEYLVLPYPVSIMASLPFPAIAGAVGAAAFGVALLGLVRFAIVFPTPLSGEHLAAYFEQKRKRRGSEQEEEENRHAAATFMRFVQSPGTAAAFLAGLVAAKLISPTAFWALIVFSTFGAVIATYLLLKVGLAVRSEDERRRILWIHGGILAAISTFAVIGILPFALIPVVGELGYALFWVLLGGWAPFISLTVLIAALALAVFYHGALDPRLVIRRTTVYGTLGVLFIMLFAVVESLVSEMVEARLGLPDMAGAAASGALVAGVVLPLRGRVSRAVNRWMPLTDDQTDDPR